MIQNSTLTYLFASALVIGALLWAYKAIAILATGDQPELVFEIAPIFFALGLVDLASPRHKHRRLFTVIGYALFVATLGGAIVGFAWVSEAIDTLFGGPLLTLLVLGGSVARYGLWPGKWRYVPLALGLSVVPVVIIGGVLETAFGERYLEVPRGSSPRPCTRIVVFGIRIAQKVSRTRPQSILKYCWALRLRERPRIR